MLSGLWGTSCGSLVRIGLQLLLGTVAGAEGGECCCNRGEVPAFPSPGEGFGDLDNRWGVLPLPHPAASPESHS